MNEVAYVVILKTGEQLRGNDIAIGDNWVDLFAEKNMQKISHNVPIHNISYIGVEEVIK